MGILRRGNENIEEGRGAFWLLTGAVLDRGLGLEALEDLVVEFRNSFQFTGGEGGEGRDAGFFQLGHLSGSDARDADKVVAFVEPLIGVGTPLTVVGPRIGEGGLAIGGEGRHLGKEGVLQLKVVVEEVGGAVGDDLVVAEDDPDGPGTVSGDVFQHLGVAAELDEVVGLGLARQLGVPDLVVAVFSANEEIGEACKLAMCQGALEDDIAVRRNGFPGLLEGGL